MTYGEKLTLSFKIKNPVCANTPGFNKINS